MPMPTTDPAKIRKWAIDFAMKAINEGKDWQEIQFDLLNGRYASLFPSAIHGGMVSDEDGEEAMSIIREAEAVLEEQDL